jgi:hypothetical protein
MSQKLNENVISKTISEREGGKVELNISQIKEVQRLLFEILSDEWFVNGNSVGVVQLLEKHFNKRISNIK